VAEEKGLDVVVDSASTVFFKSSFEITADATAAYNKAYPVTPAASAAAPKPVK
jgi:hypothetical protein